MTALRCCPQVNRRHYTEKAVASASRSSKKLMSKLLKYHVIGSAVDSKSNTTVASEGTAPAVDNAESRPSRTEPDIFQLPPLPDAQQNAEGASSR